MKTSLVARMSLLLAVCTDCEPRRLNQADSPTDGAAVSQELSPRSPTAAGTAVTMPNSPGNTRRTEPARSVLDNAAIGRLAIPFQQNDGQWDSNVAFKADTFAGTLWITTDGALVHSLLGPFEPDDNTVRAFDVPTTHARIVQTASQPLLRPEFVVRSAASIYLAASRETELDGEAFARGGALAQPRQRLPGWSLVEHFVDGHPHVARGRDKTVTNVSYFIGNDESKWASRVSTFGAVTLGEVWPGIEVRLVARGNNVEKFFHVAPGVDPSRIEMRVEGTSDDALQVLEDGSMLVRIGHGEIALSAPVAYQVAQNGSRLTVATRYVATGNRYRFAVGEYDERRELVIDPVLQSTYLGGSQDERCHGVAVDADGAVVVSGWSASSNFPGRASGAQATNQGADFVISRLNENLTAVIQSTYIGGSGGDYISGGDGVRFDSLGNVFVAGFTSSTNFPGAVGGAQASLNGLQDIVVTKLNGSLTSLLQSTYLGGSNVDITDGGLRIDSAGNVVVAGYTQSTDYPATVGGAQPSYGGGLQDVVVSRLSGSLTLLLQSTYLGGALWEITTTAPVLGQAGNLFIVGMTNSGDFPRTGGGAQSSLGGGPDMFVSRLDSTLTTLSQSTYLGGAGDDRAEGGTGVDGVGNIVVAGHTNSNNFPNTAGGAQPGFGGGTNDLVVARLNDTLTTVLQSTYIGGTRDDQARGDAIAFDGTGDVLVLGTSVSTDFPNVFSGVQPTTTGLQPDIVVSRLTGDLRALIQCTYLGGTNLDEAGGIVIDATGAVVVLGSTYSLDYPGTFGGAQPTKAGTASGIDMVLTRLTGDLRALACTSASCDDGNPCTTDTCELGSGTCTHASVAASTLCRAAAGACDIPETCPGAGAQCPSDLRRPAGYSCRATADPICDVAETCDGIANDCPTDGFAFAGSVDCCAGPGAPIGHCKPSNGTCLHDNCGLNNPGWVMPPNYDWRRCYSICQHAECTCCGAGSSYYDDPACSYGDWIAGLCADFVCYRAGDNTCLGGAENCQNAPGDCACGNGMACNPGAAQADARGCIAAVCGDGTCDAAENCGSCLADCAIDDSDRCTVDSCAAGVGMHVRRLCCGVADGLQANGCNSADDNDGNPCTTPVCVAEMCNQIGGFSAASTVCRVAAGPCDVAESCTGSSASCATDRFAITGTPCPGGMCGADGDCIPTTTTGCSEARDCPDDGNPCTAAACVSGACEQRAGGEGITCRPARSECDARESCDGVDSVCPRDFLAASETPCATGVCAENACLECVSDATCDDSNPCTIDSCGANACLHINAAPGLACGQGLGCGDDGTCSGCGSDSQCADTNACTRDVCDAGTCLHVAHVQAVACGGGVCTTRGVLECVECVATSDCQTSYLCRSNRCELDPDADADGDGLSNQRECRTPPNCRDSDGDGRRDFQDADDDNDGIPTAREASDAMRFGEDLDLDGRANWIDREADDDGLADGLDGVDLNRNGRPNYLNPDVTAYRGGITGGASLCSARSTGQGTLPRSIWLSVIALVLGLRRPHRMIPLTRCVKSDSSS